MFKASKGTQSLVVFGTMHVGRPDFFPLENRLLEAIAQARVLALEIDQAADPAKNASVMQQAMLLPPGAPNPYASLNAQQRTRLNQLLGSAGMQFAAVQGMRPWALAVVLSVQQFAAAGYRADLASDSYLASYARAKGVKVAELESVAEQLGHFLRLSDADQLRFLTDALEQAESGKQLQDLHDLVDAWGHADRAAIDQLAARAAADSSFSGVFTQKVLLEGRNGPLAERIGALLDKEGQVVVAIGLLHLVGPQSVIAKLEAKGWKFERVY
nr:TraB/GumN family protein [Massilia sp. TS11]